jgi:hypothetical protein
MKYEVTVWIRQARDRIQCWGVVNIVINIPVPAEAGNVLNS